jgi:hypothetical protein
MAQYVTMACIVAFGEAVIVGHLQTSKRERTMNKQ